MLGISRWQIFKASATAVFAVGTISLLLIYFIPAPPSTVTMATGFKGSSFEYFGQRYREIFARSHVELKLLETTGIFVRHFSIHAQKRIAISFERKSAPMS
jgi:hypothetical protein